MALISLPELDVFSELSIAFTGERQFCWGLDFALLQTSVKRFCGPHCYKKFFPLQYICHCVFKTKEGHNCNSFDLWVNNNFENFDVHSRCETSVELLLRSLAGRIDCL